MRRSLLLLLVALVGCGGGQPAKAPEAEGGQEAPSGGKPSGEGASSGSKKKAPDVSAEVGALDKKGVTKVFDELTPKIASCQEERRKKVDKLDFLSGDMQVEVRVNGDGSTKQVVLVKSTVGDRATEQCVAGHLKAARWPKPEGGAEGIAKNAFSLPMKGDREAVPWEASKADAAKGKGSLSSCTSGKKGPVEVTAYVDTDGKVIAAGASDSAADAHVADCVSEAARKLTFPSPGGWPAKVTFKVD